MTIITTVDDVRNSYFFKPNFNSTFLVFFENFKCQREIYTTDNKLNELRNRV